MDARPMPILCESFFFVWHAKLFLFFWIFSLDVADKDGIIEAQENTKEKEMTTLYRVELHSEGSTVYLLTNKGWADIVHFKENAEYRANAWVKNQERLDRMDND
jgi:hypothetical protein